MSVAEESVGNMSIHAVTPSMSSDDIKDTVNVNQSMAEPASKLQENHKEEHVKMKIVGFCAFVVTRPTLSFGKYRTGFLALTEVVMMIFVTIDVLSIKTYLLHPSDSNLVKFGYISSIYILCIVEHRIHILTIDNSTFGN